MFINVFITHTRTLISVFILVLLFSHEQRFYHNSSSTMKLYLNELIENVIRNDTKVTKYNCKLNRNSDKCLSSSSTFIMIFDYGNRLYKHV